MLFLDVADFIFSDFCGWKRTLSLPPAVFTCSSKSRGSAGSSPAETASTDHRSVKKSLHRFCLATKISISGSEREGESDATVVGLTTTKRKRKNVQNKYKYTSTAAQEVPGLWECYVVFFGFFSWEEGVKWSGVSINGMKHKQIGRRSSPLVFLVVAACRPHAYLQPKKSMPM